MTEESCRLVMQTVGQQEDSQGFGASVSPCNAKGKRKRNQENGKEKERKTNRKGNIQDSKTKNNSLIQ